MIIPTPTAHDLRLVPELAILAALEVSLAITIEVIFACNPQLTCHASHADHVDEDLAPILQTAHTLASQAAQLRATINRYRLTLLDF